MVRRNISTSGHSEKRILFFDEVQSIDILATRNIYKSILRVDGYIIHTASTADGALSSLAIHQPDLIIVTLDRFYINGCNLSDFSALKQAAPNTPILALSSKKYPKFWSSPYITEYLLVPLEKDQFQKAVARLLDSVQSPTFELTSSTNNQNMAS